MKKTIFFCSVIVTATLISACNPQKSEDVKITVTSVHESYGPEGLLKATSPGWHAKPPPAYPQIVTFTFGSPRQIGQIGFLPQPEQASRLPKKLVVEISDDANTWKALVGLETWNQVVALENDCNAPSESWRDHPLGNTVNTNNVRIKILSNCGNPSLLTLRGVRFK